MQRYLTIDMMAIDSSLKWIFAETKDLGNSHKIKINFRFNV